MSRQNARPTLEVFRRAYLVANEAFNRHDFDAAFAAFHPELEWQTFAGAPGLLHVRGRRRVIEGFRELVAEFPDFQVEPQEFIDGGDAILVRNIGRATGRTSGVPVNQPSPKSGPSGTVALSGSVNTSTMPKPSKPSGYANRRRGAEFVGCHLAYPATQKLHRLDLPFGDERPLDLGLLVAENNPAKSRPMCAFDTVGPRPNRSRYHGPHRPLAGRVLPGWVEGDWVPALYRPEVRAEDSASKRLPSVSNRPRIREAP